MKKVSSFCSITMLTILFVVGLQSPLHADQEPIPTRKVVVHTRVSLLALASGVVVGMGAYHGIHALGRGWFLKWGGALISYATVTGMVSGLLHGRELASRLSALEARLACVQVLDRRSLQGMLMDARCLERELAAYAASKRNCERIAKVIEVVQQALDANLAIAAI